MAVRPLVTTGVALLSAGALVAGTPALFVPRNEITVAASTAEAPAHKTLTAEQINLLALSLQGAWSAFTQGYGGYYYQGVVQKTDANGDPVVDVDGKPVYVYAPGDCSARGAVCQTGFTGLAYYVSNNVLPVGPLDDIFFEGGFTDFAYLASTVVATVVDAFDPTQRLQLAKRVDEFFAGGVANVIGSILNDNLPDGGYAQNLSNSFFFGYGEHTGITATITYIVDAITQGVPDPVPGGVPETASARLRLLSAEEGTEAKTEADPGSVTSTSLPNVSKLLSLPTPNIESPFKAPVSTLAADLNVKDAGTAGETVETVEGGTETTPVVEASKPEAPKFEAPKLPELKLPEIKLPQRNIETETPKAEPVAEAPSTETKTETKTDTSKTETKTDTSKSDSSKTESGNSLVRNSLVAKPGSKTTERTKSAGEKFVEKATNDLKNAFAPKSTKAKSEGAGAQGSTSDKGDSGSGADHSDN
ncbi:hypothetical protein [Mycolicibacterium sp. CBMA 295]|uniref:hypothetical protein n=1 Tax=Mycolicibacterium sp. CBMA 295 TaxID=2606605 RepID=UPI0012DCE6DF|nr:hypothetical protein [Mycolicibacterium sp. CBMA 295]MUM29955.1 hypothetical protein [Mycolicibacterium sp. CBMA 295]